MPQDSLLYSNFNILNGGSWKIMRIEEVSTVMDIVFGTGHCFGTVNIFVISQPKWLKFGLQAHFLKVFGHTKFQLSISYTFKVMRLLVMYLVISTKSFITLKVQEIES